MPKTKTKEPWWKIPRGKRPTGAGARRDAKLIEAERRALGMKPKRKTSK